MVANEKYHLEPRTMSKTYFCMVRVYGEQEKEQFETLTDLVNHYNIGMCEQANMKIRKVTIQDHLIENLKNSDDQEEGEEYQEMDRIIQKGGVNQK